MLNRVALTGLALGFCVWLACDSDGVFFVDVPLDTADAVIAISQSAGDSEATVVARITTSSGAVVQIEEGQSVTVNGEELVGPDANGEYAVTIPVADSYTITVHEPTRGVQDTTISAPAGFDITSPQKGQTVSLSGFTLNWSSADPDLTVRITLAQALFGNEEARSFGPFEDAGSLSFTALDLAAFRQGAPLSITVVKTSELNAINGFNSGTLSASLSQTTSTTPGP